MKKKIVIIGNGISGITAARFIRKKSDCQIIVISDESPYFFSRTALMYVYMGHMRFKDIQPYESDFWEKNKIELIFNKVNQVHPEQNKVELQNGQFIDYSDLIIASGSKSNVFNWPGTHFKGVQGLYHKQDLESLEERTPKIKTAIIVGGGLIGVEMAEMLLTRNIEVHFLVREGLFWNGVLPDEDAKFVGEHLARHHGLKMHYESELDEIYGDKNDEVKGVRLKDGREIKAELVGLTVGVSPNIDFLKNSSIETDRGILIEKNLRTSIPNIYAIGDCAQMRVSIGKRRALEQVWYTGRIMGETVAQTICGIEKEYSPGNWFNSAKFFDLEYQTYGWVFSKPEDSEEKFVWFDSKNERMLHFRFDKLSREFIGLNAFGIRLRHGLLDNWLNQKKSIDYIVQHFLSANFDPEFFKPFEKDLLEKFNSQFHTNHVLQAKTWWQKLLKNEHN
ncbi:MAG: FAD-dependent oxidoreductase [Bacteroidetes bacterium]|nr:FAD-dependent oxidoreductase [Bacteroidota bacterium]